MASLNSLFHSILRGSLRQYRGVHISLAQYDTAVTHPIVSIRVHLFEIADYIWLLEATVTTTDRDSL